MTAKKPSVDGFIPRRSQGQLGELHSANDFLKKKKTSPGAVSTLEKTDFSVDKQRAAVNSRPTLTPSGQGLTRADVDESLRQIDESDDAVEQKGKEKRKKSAGSSPRRKIIKRVILALIAVFLLINAWMAIKAFMASSSVFKGDIFGLVQQKELKADAGGRSNILIFGTSEDNEGGNHPGGYLTDSIMVLSVDQKKKDAFMVSIPRDLWVKYGQACAAGYEGKINEVYGCFSNDGEDSEAGAKGLAAQITTVTGLDIQYQVHVNYTVVREAVDAVGGIEVKVESEDPRGILDRNFDWKCNYQCYYVKYTNGEVAHMDGEHALAFMRARNAQGGYGLPNGNFDREKNQQKVIVALREKALSVGTLANPGKVTALIDATGDNLRTNFDTSEIRTVMSLATDIKTEAITSIDLIDPENMMMTTGSYGGVSIVKPVAGLFMYDDVHRYIKKILTADPVTKEGAKVVVLNGSGVVGAGQTAADKLEAMGFTISGVDNAPAGDYASREVYARDTSSNPETRKKLTSLYGDIKTGVEQFGVADDVQFVVILGQSNTTPN